MLHNELLVKHPELSQERATQIANWVLTPVFEWLPKYALAAIVISSVTNLVDYNEAIHLWRVKKQDCLLWAVAFLGTLFLGVQNGLLLAVGALRWLSLGPIPLVDPAGLKRRDEEDGGGEDGEQ